METIAKITAAVSSTRASVRPGSDIADSLSAAGMTVLGYGAYGAVAKSDDGVFKVFNKDEHAYNAYFNFIRSRWSTLAPRVKMMQEGGEDNRWTVIKIEELEKFETAEIADYVGVDVYYLSDLTRYIKNYLNRRLDARGDYGGYADDVYKCPAWADKLVDMKNLKGFFEKMMDAAKAHLNETGKYVYWDIHCNNVMIRKTDDAKRPYQLVITDPWCEA